YVIASSSENIAYPDKSTSRSDYLLLRDMLSPQSPWPPDADGRLRTAATIVGEASAQTDRFQDVWIKVGTTAIPASPALASFTTLSHFVNVRTPGVIWENDGYYYEWVAQNQKCTDASIEDRILNFVIANAAAKIDIPKSDSAVRYRDPLRLSVSPREYTERFEEQITHIRFWPITHLAKYWFDSFLKTSKARDG